MSYDPAKGSDKAVYKHIRRVQHTPNMIHLFKHYHRNHHIMGSDIEVLWKVCQQDTEVMEIVLRNFPIKTVKQCVKDKDYNYFKNTL